MADTEANTLEGSCLDMAAQGLENKEASVPLCLRDSLGQRIGVVPQVVQQVALDRMHEEVQWALEALGLVPEVLAVLVA